MELTQARLSREYDIPASTITMAIKRGALVKNTAGLLDTENATNKLFMAKHRLRSAKTALEDDGKAAERIIKAADFSAMDDIDLANHAGLPQKMINMSIRELVVKYRGLEGISNYIKMLRDLTAADERDQKVREKRLTLIEKDFVIARLVQYLDIIMKQLLEYPESCVDEIIALVQSQGGAARLEVSRKLEAGISKIIKDSKGQLIKELSGLRAKYQDSDGLDQKIRDAVTEVMEED